MLKHQFILNEDDQPIFAVVPYSEYVDAFGLARVQPTGNVGHQIPMSISLPNAGASAAIDLPRFAEYWVRCGIQSLPINKRAKPFRDFEDRERFSLEALIRTCFISKSYRNTMQAVSEVTDQLIATGLFREVRFNKARLMPGRMFQREQAILEAQILPYSRSVNCLEIVYDKAKEFCEQHPIADEQKIPSEWFDKDRA